MAKIDVLNMSGEKVSEKQISDHIFKLEPNKSVIHTIVVNHLANRRQGTQSTLTRTEVRGGGRKPWRQKGTGRARHGSIRAPQWTHGGIALGPKPRSYRFSVNRKVRNLAMRSALSSKFINSSLVVLDKFVINEYKTKLIINMLNALKVDKKALLVSSIVDKKVIKSASNIQPLKTSFIDELNVYDILNHYYLIMDLCSIEKVEEVYST